MYALERGAKFPPTCVTPTTHQPRSGHGVGYRYAHNFPHGVAKQQYLPDDIASTRYYDPTDHGNEAAIAQRLSQIRALLGRDIEEEKS